MKKEVRRVFLAVVLAGWYFGFQQSVPPLPKSVKVTGEMGPFPTKEICEAISSEVFELHLENLVSKKPCFEKKEL